MGYTKGLWQGMFGGMSGAFDRTDKICFRTVAEGADNCTLLLFGKGKTAPEKKLDTGFLFCYNPNIRKYGRNFAYEMSLLRI